MLQSASLYGQRLVRKRTERLSQAALSSMSGHSSGCIAYFVTKRAQHIPLVCTIHGLIMVMPCEPTKDIKWNRQRPQKHTNEGSPQPFWRQRSRGIGRETMIDRVEGSECRRRICYRLPRYDRSQGRMLVGQVSLLKSSDRLVRCT
jgi:hypothetical protein